ncbi:hypothetical protein ACO2Q3_12505 [Caulobacter sp. KR2-114]|uniref:hypothetical protein n=1 Tax=Caulobacter sp. KR2-114 TaxID=3400912 RepID=UPI003C0F78BB
MSSDTMLSQAHAAIRARQASDPMLAECRGYVFNIGYADGQPVEAQGPVDVLIMGMNPGEAPHEASGVNKASEERWIRLCGDFAAAVGGPWATTEMFFWSSNNLGALSRRVGDLEPHLQFCAELNRRLIAHHRPKVVLQPGLGWRGMAARLYDLRHIRSVTAPATTGHKPRRLLEHYVLPDGTPWLSTVHWTGAWGIRDEHLKQMRAYAAAVASGAPTSQPFAACDCPSLG